MKFGDLEFWLMANKRLQITNFKVLIYYIKQKTK